MMNSQPRLVTTQFRIDDIVDWNGGGPDQTPAEDGDDDDGGDAEDHRR